MKTAAWDGVAATGALTHMASKDAEPIAAAYSASLSYNVNLEKAKDRWFDLAAAARDDVASLDQAEIRALRPKVLASLSYQDALNRAASSLMEDLDTALKTLPATDARLDVAVTPIGELLANRRARAVLERRVPALLSYPHMDAVSGQSLREVAPYADGRLDPATLAAIQRDFDAMASHGR